MFRCDRCGSRYSSMHAATIENCPRCLIRDRISAPLSFKAFRLPSERAERAAEPAGMGGGHEERSEPLSA